MSRSVVALARAALLVALLPSAARAEQPPRCGPGGSWLGLEAGAVRYDLAGPLTGAEAGVDAGVETSAALLRAGYRTLFLGSGGPTAHVIRASARRGILRWRGVRLCATAHAGGSWLGRGDDRTTVGVIGLGLGGATAHTLGRLELAPFAEVRGLAGASTGEVLGLDVGATGLSLGVELGARAEAGRLLLGLGASVDGFAPGLGVTPFPALAGRAVIGFRL